MIKPIKPKEQISQIVKKKVRLSIDLEILIREDEDLDIYGRDRLTYTVCDYPERTNNRVKESGGWKIEEIRSPGDFSALSYKQMAFEAMQLIKDAIGYHDDLYQTFQNIENIFHCLPECENTTMTIKGIIGYHQWCQDNDASGNFLCDALHDINECILNCNDENFCPRTSSYVGYKKGGSDGT